MAVQVTVRSIFNEARKETQKVYRSTFFSENTTNGRRFPIYLFIYQFGLQRVMKERDKVMEHWMGER